MKQVIISVLIFSSIITACFGQTIKEEYKTCAIEALHKGKYKTAIEYFSRVIEIDPKDASTYFDRGQVKFDAHDYIGAEMDFTQAIKIDSTNVDHFFLRALTRDSLKKYNTAIIDFNKTLIMEPQNPDAYFYRGYAKAKLHLLNAALEDYDQAILLNPNNPDFYLKRSEVETFLKQKENTQQDIKKYKELTKQLSKP